MEGKEAFIEFLNEIMQDNEMNIEQFSDAIACNAQAVGRWLSGKYSPSPQFLIAIVIKFHTSIDYMYGLSDKKDLNYKQHTTTFYERYCYLRKLRDKNDHQISVACELGNSTVYDWKKKNTIPNIDSVLKVAIYLESSLDYLFGLA